jgi:threonine 3-dehydrogenase
MEQLKVLITGANGEMGQALIPALQDKGFYEIHAIDVSELSPVIKPHIDSFLHTDILNNEELQKAFTEHDFDIVFHLAAILSTGAEADPERAHDVNVNGTQRLLFHTKQKSEIQKKKIKFIFPSSIAVYGMESIEIKNSAGPVKEDQHTNPVTMYGINKLYCEKLGIYYALHYKKTSIDIGKGVLDFRAIRFPGIISALTVPTGGTSDFAPEMIHSAAKGEGYESFVGPHTKIPFMVMPDAVKALIELSNAPFEKLSQNVYNVKGFSVAALEIAELVNRSFPDSATSYNPNPKRQTIVDSWPEDLDDSAARKDWGWQPDHDIEKAFNDYLIPAIKDKYSASNPTG